MAIAAPLAALALLATGTEPTEAVEELERWVDRIQRGSSSFDAEEWSQLEEIVEAARATPPEEDLDRWYGAFLDLSALGLTATSAPIDFADGARGLAWDVLDDELSFQSSSIELVEWLARDVLVRSTTSRARRLAAAELLRGRYLPETKLALFTLALEDDPELQHAALQALAGWPSGDVHRFLLDRWDRLDPGARTGFLWALEAHFGSLRPPLDQAVADRLEALLSPLIVDLDWRLASRAAALTSPLPSSQAVPLLIESLRTWQSRVERDLGSLRIEWELVDQLERRSGISLGLRADRWTTWWHKARSGTLQAEDTRWRPRTRAAFYGLRPKSDRIAFVIDVSASMNGVDYRTQKSRYEAAVGELLEFLRDAGPRTRFSVTLFSDRARTWRQRLTVADERSLDTLAAWLELREPDGGTLLEKGLEAATGVSIDGDWKPEQLEADTVVILCDGETLEDAAWAEKWLQSTNGTAQLIYNGIQLGNDRGTAMETLARRTGGDFVRRSD